MAFVLPNAKKRLCRKQVPPAAYVAPAPVLAALADEAWSELTALSEDARRKHVHWVHVRTDNPAHKQPDSFTREDFWRHLERVYRDVYPSASTRTGSILLFGVVAKEKHAHSEKGCNSVGGGGLSSSSSPPPLPPPPHSRPLPSPLPKPPYPSTH